jgi:flagellar hook-basal body complex protein FliE
MPVDAIGAAEIGGPDWSIAMPAAPSGADDAGAVQGSGDSTFGSMISNQLEGLQGLQTEAAAQSQALATGQAEDAATVVMAVERAQLSMQLAAQQRDKGLEAFQEVFRTQV